MTCAAARNSARIWRKSAATVARCATRKSALWMGFRLSTTPAAEPTAITARIQNATWPGVIRACSAWAGCPAGGACSGRRGWARARWGGRRAPPGPGAPAAVGGELEDARVHADGVLRARLDAVAAEDALAEVDVEALGHLLDLGVRVLRGDDVDAVGRADRLAPHAGDAAGRAGLRPPETGEAPEPRRGGA